MWPQKFALSVFTVHKWKTLKRQKDLQSYNLTSFRESYCRRQHLGYCSESLKANKRLNIHDLRIRSQLQLFADSNLRYSRNHILQWTYSIPREQKGCQSTWMNHSETHNINLLAGQRTVRQFCCKQDQRTKRWLCAIAQMYHRKKNTPGAEERVQTSSFISLYLESEGIRLKYSIWSRLKARTEASAKLAVQ